MNNAQLNIRARIASVFVICSLSGIFPPAVMATKSADTPLVVGFKPYPSHIVLDNSERPMVDGNAIRLIGYQYNDSDGDAADASTYQWYRSDTTSPQDRELIAGATDENYTPVAADKYKFLALEITLRSLTGQPNMGGAVHIYTGRVGDILMNFSYPIRVKMNRTQAINYCNDLSQHGYSDWRLPSQSELVGLYNMLPNNIIATEHYWPTDLFWSITTASGGRFILVSLRHGGNISTTGTDTREVTCIR